MGREEADMVLAEAVPWIVAGIAGAIVRIALVEQGRVVLWRWGRTAEGRCYFDMGFLTTVFTSIAAAVLVDRDWTLAFAAAIAGPHVIERFLPKARERIEGVVKKLSAGEGDRP